CGGDRHRVAVDTGHQPGLEPRRIHPRLRPARWHTRMLRLVLWQWGATLSYDNMAQVFSNPQLLVPQGAGLEDTISYPSWSPDSRWLAVGVRPTDRDPDITFIHRVAPTTGNHTRRARGGLQAGNDVFPSFSTSIEGGYYWLLFYSSRPYGHVTTHKQLWVMAIETGHQNGVDSSHPAFWLPGQDTNNTNISGYWAPNPCIGDGGDCNSTAECCMGLTCSPDANGNPICGADMCALPGEPCTSDADCCESSPTYYCLPSLGGENVCQQAPN